jgi:pimeloyl-ACP methyl ester carboxylesterase
VRRGQALRMERVTFKNSRKLTLVGNFHPAASDAAIILAHGFTSDKSALGRFDKLAESLNGLGYNVLAFDFSGSGESDPDILAADKMADDLNSAIAFLRARNCRRIALYGHSLGGLICLMCASPEIGTMVLTGAPTDSMHYDWTAYYSPEQLRDLEENGYLTAKDRTGRERMIGRQMLKDFEEIDQRELLKNTSCPVLLIHGNDPRDQEECLLLERSQRGIRLLPAGSKLEIIDGANHTFLGHWHRVVEMACEWYLSRMPPRLATGQEPSSPGMG